MALEVLEKKEINSNELDELDELNKIQKNKKQRRINVLIVFIIILLLLLICYRIATIGFNSVEAWEVDKIELTKENLQIANNTKINVFSGLNTNGKLAPMSNGTYRFSVKNNSSYDMIYNINFEHDMTNYINMKYRLKIDNIYIKGNDNEYVDIDNLNVESIIVPKHSINVYTLEWKWENDDANDIKVGMMKDDQYYYFKMQIFSNIYEK